MAAEPIAILGTGCRFPGDASSPSRLWELLKNPRVVASEPPSNRFDIDSFYHKDPSYPGTTNTREGYFLSDDPRSFDAPFFNISAAEAGTMDPQQRQLLETVFESIEAAGQRLDQLQGSATGVFCGVMGSDWGEFFPVDFKSVASYAATGGARSCIANRVSYFFDWHGPSVVIDTACSSSMVALHQAVTALQRQECSVAVAAGTNLLLNPSYFITTAKMTMLSPDGRGRMWDSNANGYARGEGIASVVLKRLSDAVADGDPIECVIKATGVNQDGRTMGLTMPSGTSQLELIQNTYARAGLDPRNPRDRCQYFEAHGTGTKAGDPQEASAVHQAFFGPPESGDKLTEDETDLLYVGSIKTVVGHTEGLAGLAGIIKASLSIQNGSISPNLLYEVLNPEIEPLSKHVKVPTQLMPWPSLPPGVPRRASVNSFGFGGTNAHAILESYDPELVVNGVNGISEINGINGVKSHTSISLLPFVFSAAAGRSLVDVLESYERYLQNNPDVDLMNLAWTLLQRRSALRYRLPLWAPNTNELLTKIRTELDTASKDHSVRFIHQRSVNTPKKIIGVFTGQGAQWPQMGIDVISNSPEALDWLQEMQDSLDQLPAKFSPTFTLLEELSNSAADMSNARLSQPLCTALQIILVRILSNLGITFTAVVGHSSGEIAAAYVAGYLTATDAIRIAYLRGLVTSQVGAKSGNSGAMMAVGMSAEEAIALCKQEEYQGRVAMAASNAASSVTLSGDADAIRELEQKLQEENKFARRLRVDTAYHSHHMYPCSPAYKQALEDCNIRIQPPTGTAWYSSVYDGVQINLDEHENSLTNEYWIENMVRPVLFSQAVQTAVRIVGEPDLVIEVGPHPALKGPAKQVLADTLTDGNDIPYIGVSARGTGGIEALASAIGDIWGYLGPSSVDISRYTRLFGSSQHFKLIKELPEYPFNHSKLYSTESRLIKQHLHSRGGCNPLIGNLEPTTGDGEWRWHHYLRQKDLPWLDGHRVESQMIFPATGYISMAVEAAGIIAASRPMHLIQIRDFVIHQAIVLPDDVTTSTEVLVQFNEDRLTSKEKADTMSGTFQIHACTGEQFQLRANGSLTVTWGQPETDSLASRSATTPGLTALDVNDVYSFFDKLGYSYTGPFRGIQSISRKKDNACAELSNDLSSSNILLHPTVMDTTLQTMIAALGTSDDGEVSTLLIPTRIQSLTINPIFCGQSGVQLAGPTLSSAAVAVKFDADDIIGDLDLFTKQGYGMVQLSGIEVSSLHPLPKDRRLFAEMSWGPYEPDAKWESSTSRSTDITPLIEIAEKATLLCMKFAFEQLTAEDRQGLDWHRATVVAWFERVISMTREGTHPICNRDWLDDTREDLDALFKKGTGLVELEITKKVFDNVVAFIRGEASLLEALREDSLLTRFYCNDTQTKRMNESLGCLVGQVAFRYPRMKILEIGGGTGSATRAVLSEIGFAYHSYTFTDISVAFFEDAKAALAAHEDRFIYEALDISRDPLEQGFEEHSYDLVVASNVLHATKFMQQTMTHVRRLLKPGGYLAMLEVTNQDLLSTSFIVSGFEGWWSGHEDGRVWGPMLTLSGWDNVLKSTGFSGVDTYTSTVDNPKLSNYSVIISQAVDEHIQLLRNPMTPNDKLVSELVILGGATNWTGCLVSKLSKALESSFIRIHHAQRLEALDLEQISQQSNPVTVLSLIDIGWPWFQDLSKDRLVPMQGLVTLASKMLWVTAGSEKDCPYMGMSKGWLKSLAYENKHCLYQYLNIEDQKSVDVTLICSTLMRLVHTDKPNDYKLSTEVHSTESELLFKDGSMQIPRIRSDQATNDRYLAARQHISRQVELSNSTVCVIPASEGKHSLRLIETQNKGTVDANHIQIRTRYSTAQAIPVGEGIFLHLVLGEDEATGTRLLSFTDHHASSIQVPAAWTRTVSPKILETEEASFLKATADFVVGGFLIREISPNSTLLVHEAAETLRQAIHEQALEKGIKPLFTTTTQLPSTRDAIFLPPKASPRVLAEYVPQDVSLATCLGSDPEHALIFSHIDRLLPEETLRKSVRDIYKTSAILSKQIRVGMDTLIAHRLESAGALAIKSASGELVNIVEVNSLSTKPAVPGCIVDWVKSTSVSAQIQPINSLVTLSGAKTYLLAGLAGDLGQSISSWMISKGARYIVLASRTPKVDPLWIEAMAKLGATVVPMAMDLTNRESVLNVYRSIQCQYPPLGGVANGALVLEDCEFVKASLDAIERNVAPKVQGSILLDELSGPNVDLDFFILFGSMMGVTGNWSQSAYSAATCFQASLIHRRRARGLVGSIIHLGLVNGIGIIARKGAGHINYVKNTTGSYLLSERDVDKFFAEAIFAGHPQSGRNAELMNGTAMVDPDEYPEIGWFEKPLIWNMISYHAKSNAERSGTAEGPSSVKAQFELATSMAEVLEIVEASLTAKVRSKFSLDADVPLPASTRLQALGMDSLVAVDLRAWIAKEMGVDVPLLEILSGGTIKQLTTEVSSTLPPTLIPNVSDAASIENE
ncbi:uncharacterized protein TRUGW13939_08991 [Talaromyces rugulosus]|uniref:Uncharacterized protein n=1 Tax=Talaromyces rugulosus TaxID=121627 RepID=A0A7H8R888_TALRU|nr:uncharacterized protein TRUGW13939_08991 [Talaromyces rugulosus]QKX61835.1 hypothetical protein TRUGW13939_08991 [Talaromyces rugulosus]